MSAQSKVRTTCLHVPVLECKQVRKEVRSHLQRTQAPRVHYLQAQLNLRCEVRSRDTPWLQFTLFAPAEISAVRIHNRLDCCQEDLGGE